MITSNKDHELFKRYYKDLMDNILPHNVNMINYAKYYDWLDNSSSKKPEPIQQELNKFTDSRNELLSKQPISNNTKEQKIQGSITTSIPEPNRNLSVFPNTNPIVMPESNLGSNNAIKIPEPKFNNQNINDYKDQFINSQQNVQVPKTEYANSFPENEANVDFATEGVQQQSQYAPTNNMYDYTENLYTLPIGATGTDKEQKVFFLFAF